jgi:hypothetical protein
MLDRWQLWTQRAKLDVLRGSFFELKPPPQVFVRCNFCNTPLTFEREEKSAAPQQGQQMPPGFGQGMAKAGYNNMFGGARRGGSEKKRVRYVSLEFMCTILTSTLMLVVERMSNLPKASSEMLHLFAHSGLHTPRPRK